MRAAVLSVVLLAVGCGGGGGGDGGLGGGGGAVGGGVGGGGVGGGAGGTDGGADAGPGLIGEVLTCGRLGSAGGLGGGLDLQRYDFDGAEFPDALCNDGSPALFYFRPASTVASRNRWVIQLQGGGSCDTPKACAERWCSVNTNFGKQGMSAGPAPAATSGRGILERRPDNPFGTWNHVYVKYCSSDTWAGTRRDVVVTAPDPIDGGPRTFRYHALGSRIIDATVDVLRRDAGVGLTWNLDGGAVALPDLDEAEIVVLAGASGGGAGTIHNVDRLRALLRSHNVNCQGGPCPLVFRALIDSIVMPSLETLDFSTSTLCDAGVCDYVTFRDQVAALGGPALWGIREDESCVSWHQANAPATRSACNDHGHVLRNHVTTPFFVRQGQTDSLLSSSLLALGFSVPDGGVLDLPTYAQLVRRDLRALDAIQSTAEEGAAIAVVPGAFGPTCPDHETLSDQAQVYGVFIDGGAAGPLGLFDVVQNWVTSTPPSIVVADVPGDNTCP